MSQRFFYLFLRPSHHEYKNPNTKNQTTQLMGLNKIANTISLFIGSIYGDFTIQVKRFFGDMSISSWEKNKKSLCICTI